MGVLTEFYVTNQLLQSEFNSENLYFDIKIRQNIPKICLIFNSFGPFTFKETKTLPLWFLMFFEKMEFGYMIGPKWLETKWLKKKILLEIDDENLQSIPRNYIEVIYIFYKHKTNHLEIGSNHLILAEEIFSVRINKLTTGLLILDVPIRALKLKFVGSIELINFRKIMQMQLGTINMTNLN